MIPFKMFILSTLFVYDYYNEINIFAKLQNKR
jgi:hypothetical protein